MILLGVELRLIFFREDVVALQILGGINMLGFFLLRLLAGAFLTSGFGDILILRVRPRGEERGAGDNQDTGQTETEEASERAHGCHGAGRNLGV